MKGQGGPAAGAANESAADENDPGHAGQGQDADWGDGRVAPMGDDFLELDENTERVDDDTVDRAPAVKTVAPARPAHHDKLARERRATVVSPIPAELAKSMMNDLPGTLPGTPAAMHHQATRPI